MSNANNTAAPVATSTLSADALRTEYRAARAALRAVEERLGGVVPRKHPAMVRYLAASEAWAKA